MRNLFAYLAEKVNHARKYLHKKVPYRLIFIITGLLATLWFLLRVIPKPSRAGYPCMRAAAPLMSGFILYMLSFSGSFFAFRHARRMYGKKRLALATMLILAGIISGGIFFYMNGSQPAFANIAIMQEPPDGANNPMGIPQGIIPGRVVWAWNPDATNPDMSNVPGDAFWDFKNNDTLVIRNMVENSVLWLANTTDASEAWDAIFRYHNQRRDLENRGYREGEKIFVKINQGTASWLVNNMPEFGWPESGGLEALTGAHQWKRNNFGATETGPFIVLNILRQLVYVAGIPQENIYVGDPMSIIFKHNYDIWYKEFPNIKYVDKRPASQNRHTIIEAQHASMTYSDRGAVLGSGFTRESYFEEMEEADYMINIATLKAHKHGGITLCAKNHFGSITRNGAPHLHPSLIATATNRIPNNHGYRKYRVKVDIMRHKYLGGNTMLFIVEGLFGGSEDEVLRPIKYHMEPFNNNWANSLFMSLDQVALESVCYDFLRTEFDGVKNPGLNGGYPNWPNWEGVDDYLHQAAERSNWPSTITYDPDGRGPFESLGVHEHWNNPIDKQYSRNLGFDKGIELIKTNGFTEVDIVPTQIAEISKKLVDLTVYPNPFSTELNIGIQVDDPGRLNIELFDMQGKRKAILIDQYSDTGNHVINWRNTSAELRSGYYILRVSLTSGHNSIQQSIKVQHLH